jgi:hypothetical protein
MTVRQALACALAALAAAVHTGCDSPTTGVAEDVAYSPAVPASGGFMRGMTYATFQAGLLNQDAEYANIDRMLALGCDWVAVTPIWYQDSAVSTVVAPDPAESPGDDEISRFIAYLHAKGIKVLLKPCVDARDGAWRAEFNPQSVESWFESYRDFIFHFAEMAAAANVEMFCAGCEYKWSDENQRDQWALTIQGIRQRYPGKLVYAADWSNYQRVAFWDLVDFVGIDAYFPLSFESDPPLSKLRDGWAAALDAIEGWLRSSGLGWRKVVFTEVGYESKPGCWQNPGDTSGASADAAAQDACYKALLMTAPARDWLDGIVFWWWDNPSTHDAGGGPDNAGWTPKGKPAEQTLASFHESF